MKKIGLILILIIILPIAFLLVNELGKLNENEQVLEQIYNDQLQAILFSVNLLLNVLWSFSFFFLQNPTLAFIDLIILGLSIIAIILFVKKIEKKSAWLLVPYLLWISFAGILNYLIAFG